MQETETLLSIIQQRQLWNEMLESHVPGNSQAWFGEGQLEKGHYTAPRWLPTPLRTSEFRSVTAASTVRPLTGFIESAGEPISNERATTTDWGLLLAKKQVLSSVCQIVPSLISFRRPHNPL